MKKIETDDDWKRFRSLTGSEFSLVSFIPSDEGILKTPKSRVLVWVGLILVGFACGRYVHGLHALISVFLFPYMLFQGYKFQKSSIGVYDYYWVDCEMKCYTKKIISLKLGEAYKIHQINFVGSLLFVVFGFVVF